MSAQKSDDLLQRSHQKFLVLLLSLFFICFLRLTFENTRHTAIPASVKFQVDLNTAEEAELLLLPGVGVTLAKRILEYRTQHGPFQRNEDILLISGIGSKKAEKIIPMLRAITNNQ